MLKFNHTFSLVLALTLFNFAAHVVMAQALESVQQLQTSPTVTVAPSGEVVRFTAPGNVTFMRLEVFSSTGEKIFDSGKRDGNVLDWHWQDEKALAFSTDTFLCVVTVQRLSGNPSRKIGSLSFARKQASLKAIEVAQLNSVQAQALSANENDTPLTIIEGKQDIAATVIANDGTDGQLTRSRGAISFRFGDFFSGRDKEQMRLTEDGNLGIGTSTPQATLDVAGTVRASEGFRFSDGTTLTANNGKLIMSDANGGSIPTANATGTGTLNQVAKWTETGGAGTLGDSAITEVGGNVGIGLPNPAVPLHILGSTETVRQQLSNTNSFIQFGFYEGAVKKGAFGFQGSTSTGFIGGPGAMVFGTLTASPVAFFTNGTEKVRLGSDGNVGIGTTTPASSLHLNGNSSNFALTLTNSANDPGKRGYRIAFDNNRLTFQRAGDSGSFSANHVAIDQATGNVGIGTIAPAASLHVVGVKPPTKISGLGNNATEVLRIVGGAGGDTTAQAFSPGGTGGGVLIQGGDGGIAIGGVSQGGNGGSITLQPGIGGAGNGSGLPGAVVLNGPLSLNGSQGQAGQVVTSNGMGTAPQWTSPTNPLYQSTNMVIGTATIEPPNNIPTPLPGLAQTIVVSGNAKLLVHFNVRLHRGVCSGCDPAAAYIDIQRNGGLENRFLKSVFAPGPTFGTDDLMTGSWVISVGPGTHRIELLANRIGASVSFGCNPDACTLLSNLIVQTIRE